MREDRFTSGGSFAGHFGARLEGRRVAAGSGDGGTDGTPSVNGSSDNLHGNAISESSNPAHSSASAVSDAISDRPSHASAADFDTHPTSPLKDNGRTSLSSTSTSTSSGSPSIEGATSGQSGSEEANAASSGASNPPSPLAASRNSGASDKVLIIMMASAHYYHNVPQDVGPPVLFDSDARDAQGALNSRSKHRKRRRVGELPPSVKAIQMEMVKTRTGIGSGKYNVISRTQMLVRPFVLRDVLAMLELGRMNDNLVAVNTQLKLAADELPLLRTEVSYSIPTPFIGKLTSGSITMYHRHTIVFVWCIFNCTHRRRPYQ